ncbi:unnamed protein product, partial [Ixodes pacificus]
RARGSASSVRSAFLVLGVGAWLIDRPGVGAASRLEHERARVVRSVRTSAALPSDRAVTSTACAHRSREGRRNTMGASQRCRKPPAIATGAANRPGRASRGRVTTGSDDCNDASSSCSARSPLTAPSAPGCRYELGRC